MNPRNTGGSCTRNSDDSIYDVAIVGYGPAGGVLASTLGAAGVRVLMIEKWPELYPLPRLTTLDGEVCRVVQATGLDIDRAFEECSEQRSCNFVDAAGDPLLVIRYDGELGGWPSRMSVFQPDFERSISAKVDTMSNVEVCRGWEVTGLVQHDEHVKVTFAPFHVKGGLDTAASRTVKVKYLVGTDGARSFVRQTLGVEVRDFNMHERWLNFDAEILQPLPKHLRDLNIYLDPDRPHMHMPIGKRRLRLEFRVMEGETDEEMCDPREAWSFLKKKHSIGSDHVRIMRQVVYHYHTKIAQTWRVGRVFIAGDAAHTMPPYMGQGGCSAIRDGRNLGWKLIEVLSGRSDEALLDEYQIEREPHVTTLVMASDKLSRVVNIVDHALAEKRNEGMRHQGEAHPPDLPKLGAGVLYRTGAGDLTEATGVSAPQGRLRQGDVIVRGDEVLGTGFQLWCRQDPATWLGDDERAYLLRLGCVIAVFDQPISPSAVDDVDGVYREFLNRYSVDAVLLRPDFYVFGAVLAEDLNAMVNQLRTRLYSSEGRTLANQTIAASL